MILNYIVDNFPFLFLASGFIFLIVVSKNNMEKELNYKMIMIIGCLFILSVVVFMDSYYQSIGVDDKRRMVCAVIGYILRPTSLIFLINMTVKDKKYIFTMWGVNIVNAFIMIGALFSDSVFYYENNVIKRGIFGYTFYIVMTLLIIIFLVSSFMFLNSRRFEETAIVFFISVMAVIGAVIEMLSPLSKNQWLVISFAIGNLLYYANMHMHFAKIDPLTGTLNRQYYETYIVKRDRQIKAAVSMDLNNLKYLNDNMGHEAGDLAISTVAKIFQQGLRRTDEIFRIGGDEFVIVSDSPHEVALKENIEELKRRVEKAGYSCAAGYAMRRAGESMEAMIKRSDEMMYEDKKRMKVVRGQAMEKK